MSTEFEHPMILTYMGVTIDQWKVIIEWHRKCLGEVPTFAQLVEENTKLRGQIDMARAHSKIITEALK